MRITDLAIITSSQKYGENSALVRVLSREHGIFAGIVRGASSKNNRGIIQQGNIVNIDWNARLEHQLGNFKFELTEAHAAHIMSDAGKLNALASACYLIENSFPERHPYPKLFSAFCRLLHSLSAGNDWQEEYVKFELNLLAESGFGLDLNSCAATEKTEDLIYVSPKSGRAVCAQAGEPYKNKLLNLPQFLRSHESRVMSHESLKEILAGMELTGYFLEHSLLAPHGKKLPAARSRLIEELKK